ncbi:Diguanylate cyclase with PAS/PAC sensor [Pseudodesulfovibrio piezophilus C1TLV30]|uniref:diguanylate cyclase n=1 Tax=Pseudodesulfovibrio piezophilus (strain DSM 21447 / JCM 15486 / C1TLV30) TaxID=1322246 RepID=M1WY64_PSEP2|nr:Diguanylate cyclase with PAS/PAC sensor [Pseudodesulfovibrio piezophilus C1TLV30]
MITSIPTPTETTEESIAYTTLYNGAELYRTMTQEVFRKENRVLDRAKTALDDLHTSGESVNPAFSSLIKGYEKLLRQSHRLVTMGDRMQQNLSELNRELGVSEEKYRGIFENVTEGIYRCGSDGRLIEVNPAMATMFGFKDSAQFLSAIPTLQALFCNEEDYARYESLLVVESVRQFEVKVCGPKGLSLWAEISASAMHEEGNGRHAHLRSGVVGVLADVTERKHMVEEMCRLARTDSLTGLWNRRYFMEVAGREIARASRNKTQMSLLILDADYFKCVNDNYGHDIGDKALVVMSRLLLDSVRDVDAVGRYGGEEFVVLLPDASRKAACYVAERILKNIRRTKIEHGKGAFSMTVSIGLASLEEEETLDGLLKYADIALYAAKKNGRDRVEIYSRSECPCSVDEEGSEASACAGREQ